MEIANLILLSVIAFLLLVLVECNENAQDAFGAAVADVIVGFIVLAILAAVLFGIGYVFF